MVCNIDDSPVKMIIPQLYNSADKKKNQSHYRALNTKILFSPIKNKTFFFSRAFFLFKILD